MPETNIIATVAPIKDLLIAVPSSGVEWGSLNDWPKKLNRNHEKKFKRLAQLIWIWAVVHSDRGHSIRLITVAQQHSAEEVVKGMESEGCADCKTYH
jgi:hypothetical protein